MGTRILIADSQVLFADALARSISAATDFEVVPDHPTTGMLALSAVERHRPGIVLLDYWIEGLLGPAVVSALKTKLPDVRIVLLSWLHGPREINNALLAGAVGFLPKSVTVSALLELLEEAARGDLAAHRTKLAGLIEELSERDRQTADQWKKLGRLTPRELQILALINTATPMNEIARQLGLSQKTVRNYINSMLAKTGARSQVEALAIARDFGLIGG